MMKRTILILLLVSLTVLPLSAFDNRIGAGISGSYGWYKVSDLVSSKGNHEFNQYQIGAAIEGANFFFHGLGAGYGILMDFPLSVKLDGAGITRTSSDLSRYFFLSTASLYLQLIYKFQFTSRFAMEAGLGLSSQFGFVRRGSSPRYSRSFFNFIAEISFDYEVYPSFLLRLAVRGSVPFYSREREGSTRYRTSYKGVQAGASLGVSYAY